MSNARRWARLLVWALPVVLLNTGCARSETKNYNVVVRNQTSSMLRDVAVRYEDGTWGFRFGILGVGKGGTYSGANGMPPIPQALTVTWRDQMGVETTVVAEIPKTVRERARTQNGELEITVKDHNRIVINFVD